MRVASLLTSLMLSACSTFGIRTVEQPPYTVIDKVGAIDVRSYGERTAAETTVADSEVAARSDGFRKLARYIFGGNAGQQSIAMTAPVAQASVAQTSGAQTSGAQSPEGQQIAMTAPVSQVAAGPDTWIIRFFLPATLTAATAPKPLDAAVRIVTVPPTTVAVRRFSGNPGASAVASERSQLLNGLQAGQWEPVGDPVTWFYDPPWTLPPLRRNEVAVEVRHHPE